MFNRKYIFKGSIFHCYLEGTCFVWERKFQTQGLCHLYSFRGQSFGQSQDARKSCKHCWWDRIYAPTYVSWSIPPMHPKRPQMKGIPSVVPGICWKSLFCMSHGVVFLMFTQLEAREVTQLVGMGLLATCICCKEIGGFQPGKRSCFM